MGRIDYDAGAESYAAHRQADDEVLDAIRRGGRVGSSSRVLEVGCGTGNYVIALHAATGASCWGLDPSVEMLARARGRGSDITYVLGRAEALPFRDGEFDLVYSIDVVHHMDDPAAALREASRVLPSGGRICVGTEDEAGIASRLHSHYFPETLEVERGRIPDLETLRSAFAAAGFADIREERTSSPYEISDSAPFRERAFSSLQLISAEAFERGLVRLERDLEAGPIRAVSRQLLVWGTKP